MTAFYMKYNTGMIWVNSVGKHLLKIKGRYSSGFSVDFEQVFAR